MIRRLTCPTCDKELPPGITGESGLFPFCSRRCKEVDLYRWMNGEYALVERLTPEKLFEHLGEDESEL